MHSRSNEGGAWGTAVKEIEAISISNDTVKSRISDLSEDILLQVVAAVKSSPVYSLQLDESTDVASCSQLFVYVRYFEGEVMREKYLFLDTLATTTRGQDVFRILEAFLLKYWLGWVALVGLCTDGAPSLIGCTSGF